MSDATDILKVAQERSRNAELGYAGAVTPQEAYALLQSDPSAKLVDVRTDAERDWVGRVALPKEKQAAVQWNLYPGGTRNSDFLAQLSQVADKNETLLFLCRSGARSHHAAKLATEHGYGKCFNVLEGFEGDKDAEGHRKTVAGWCKAGLPWIGA